MWFLAFLSYLTSSFTGSSIIHWQWTALYWQHRLSKKSVLLCYADNTCLTGKNRVALKYVNIRKACNLSFWNFFFPSLQRALKGKGGGIEMFQLASREYLFGSITSVDNNACTLLLSFPHQARSPASFAFCGIVSEESTFWFVLMCMCMPPFFSWHTLNIQYHLGVKSISEFRFHKNGYGLGYAMEMIDFGGMCWLKYYKSTPSCPWHEFW